MEGFDASARALGSEVSELRVGPFADPQAALVQEWSRLLQDERRAADG
jgi:hypothetical protein